MKPFVEDDTIQFGKYEGEDLTSVANNDPSYLYWALGEFDLDSDEVEAIQTALGH